MFLLQTTGLFAFYEMNFVKPKHQKVINSVFLSKFIKYLTASLCTDLQKYLFSEINK